MDNLTEQTRAIIRAYPLNTSLHHLREPLREAEQVYEQGLLTGNAAPDGSDSVTQDTLSLLLSALQASKVAHQLSVHRENVAIELSEIFQQVLQGIFSYQHYHTISKLIVDDADDISIWSAVFTLISTVTQPAPRSISASLAQTPPTRSCASIQGRQQTRSDIEMEMLEEIRGRTYRNVGGFFEKYFLGRAWSNRIKVIYNAMQNQYRDGKWIDFPVPPHEDDVWAWLSNFQDKYLAGSPGVFCRTTSTSDVTGGEVRCQVDVLIKKRGVGPLQGHAWKDLRVIGKLKKARNPPRPILLQVAGIISEIFANQPHRPFVHCFFLQGDIMELWVFDRSGPYSSGAFSIHKKPEQFIQAIVGYAMMDDEELGLDTITKLEKSINPPHNIRIISINRDSTGKDEMAELEEPPIFQQRAVVCRGTSCYRSHDQEYVVKFSWTSDKRKQEAELLRLAREKGVQGIAEIIAYKFITSIEKLRAGLEFQHPYVFQEPKAFAHTALTQTVLSQSVGTISDGNTSQSSSKRKRSQDGKASQTMSVSSVSPEWTYPSGQDNPTQKSSTTSVNKDSKFVNRLQGCLVISPAGHTLSEFANKSGFGKPISLAIKELITAFRDAIKGHRSLYLDAGILHRDISENNIIITKRTKPGDFAGMLIDLDLAIEVNDGPSGARHKTGTLEFMAIEVLLGINHTYRHDLESFFYVLIWICGRRGWEFCSRPLGRPLPSRLSGWNTDSFVAIADRKLLHTSAFGFELILQEFPNEFDHIKPLCMELRDIIFPLEQNGKPFTGTPSHPAETLYDAILLAFERALANL